MEDDAAIRAAVRVALRNEGYEVDALPDGIGIDRAAERFRPDLAILDVRLQVGPDGFDLARSLRDAINVPILFVTAADAIEYRLAGFAAGADDYVIKPFSMSELLARTSALLRRSGRQVSRAWQVADLLLDDMARTAVRAGTKLDLTRTEYDLLAAFMRHNGQVLSKSQLLSHVWGFDAVDVNLVEVQVSALRRKLEAHGPRLIHTERGVGYVLKA